MSCRCSSGGERGIEKSGKKPFVGIGGFVRSSPSSFNDNIIRKTQARVENNRSAVPSEFQTAGQVSYCEFNKTALPLFL